MQLITQQQIDQFVGGQTIAIAGASRNPKSFSADVVKHLTKQNYKLWLVNPNFGTEEAASRKTSAIMHLPDDVNHLLVLTPATETASIVQQAADKGIKNIWIQQHSETSESIQIAQQKGINLIHHQCIFMFTKPTGMHKLHRSIIKIFGGMPK